MTLGLTRNGYTPKCFGTVAVVLILATFAHISFSEECTPETCPDSPIYVEFENEDCSGAREYYSLDQPWNKCQAQDGEYQRYSYTDAYLDIETYQSPFCGEGLEYPTMEIERRHFGRCFGAPQDFVARGSKLKIELPSSKRNSKGGIPGYMWLRNAKQQISPQPYVFKPGKPWASDDDAPCRDYQDCASKGFLFQGYFDNSCNNPGHYRVFNGSANVCYQALTSNIAFSCYNKHTLQSSASRNEDCSLPFASYFFGGKCGVGRRETVYCTAGGSLPKTILTQKIGH